jgi:hypothetical protein
MQLTNSQRFYDRYDYELTIIFAFELSIIMTYFTKYIT